MKILCTIQIHCSFAQIHIESDCLFIVGFISFIQSIPWIRQSILLWRFHKIFDLRSMSFGSLPCYSLTWRSITSLMLAVFSTDSKVASACKLLGGPVKNYVADLIWCTLGATETKKCVIFGPFLSRFHASLTVYKCSYNNYKICHAIIVQ